MVKIAPRGTSPNRDPMGRGAARPPLLFLPRLYRPASQMMIPARYASKTTSSDFPVKGIALFLLLSAGEIVQSCKANKRHLEVRGQPVGAKGRLRPCAPKWTRAIAPGAQFRRHSARGDRRSRGGRFGSPVKPQLPNSEGLDIPARCHAVYLREHDSGDGPVLVRS